MLCYVVCYDVFRNEKRGEIDVVWRYGLRMSNHFETKCWAMLFSFGVFTQPVCTRNAGQQSYHFEATCYVIIGSAVLPWEIPLASICFF